MGTDRRRGGPGRGVRMYALLGCSVIVLAGCEASTALTSPVTGIAPQPASTM
ncbi:hypothetical protein JHN49_21110, partial [Streptomyces sp. MBT57]|nr:hypothetical protein [Streptomyces sp. MBT57]